jgi:dTDP-4-amino-4,6-dideoxygalactose transaminase
LKVPLLDLKAQYATIKDEVLRAVAEVLESQVCIGGPNVAELEQRIAAMSDCKYAVGVSSGTDALLCSLMAKSIGPGDEVITTPFTFFATVGSIVRAGATPVFVDIDPDTYNLNPELLEQAITLRTKAIIPVHLFGQMCDMGPIMKVANQHGIHVIEDAAQSITATYFGQKAGSIGSCGCFSFFPSKNLGAAGDGGMIVTNDTAIYERLTILRNHGAKPKYCHQFIGGNFRLDPIQAAVVMVKIPHLDGWSEKRRQNAEYYNGRFSGTRIQLPYVQQGCVSVVNQYVIRTSRRDDLIKHLKLKDVGCEIYYPAPMHTQACFRALGKSAGDFPKAESACSEVLALPIYPELTVEQLNYVADSVLEFLES